MPILPSEPDLFPLTLLDSDNSTAMEKPWWALYTLPRREKELMRRLRRLGIAHYTPLISHRSQSPKGRKRESFMPLFPSYVFLCGGEDERYQAVTTNCVSRSLPVDDRTSLIRDLRQIRRLIESDAPLTPEARLEPGMRVRIRGGLLVGLEGTVIRRRGGDRLLVAVEFLQRGASLQLEDYQVEPVSP